MSGRHRIAVVLIAVMTGLPGLAAACAMACEVAPAVAASEEHSCEAMASPSTGARLTAASPHDCASHDAAATKLTATAHGRAGFWAPEMTLAPATLHSANPLASSGQSIPRSGAPPGALPTTPLVLRI